ncbi:hypothetical protein FA15DRAFT_666527 [Coprinopsis marcescibilis]|uniref:Uncharacterized protein n=1 Tax=Coprinopsis marcescibilis TaxID=230819 RepID=A0A5C3L3P2_COPMA|nr:hypothetical protein FA15DRAFT_666527 [Coprinopsis marcescibilis]
MSKASEHLPAADLSPPRRNSCITVQSLCNPHVPPNRQHTPSVKTEPESESETKRMLAPPTTAIEIAGLSGDNPGEEASSSPSSSPPSTPCPPGSHLKAPRLVVNLRPITTCTSTPARESTQESDDSGPKASKKRTPELDSDEGEDDSEDEQEVQKLLAAVRRKRAASTRKPTGPRVKSKLAKRRKSTEEKSSESECECEPAGVRQ